MPVTSISLTEHEKKRIENIKKKYGLSYKELLLLAVDIIESIPNVLKSLKELASLKEDISLAKVELFNIRVAIQRIIEELKELSRGKEVEDTKKLLSEIHDVFVAMKTSLRNLALDSIKKEILEAKQLLLEYMETKDIRSISKAINKLTDAEKTIEELKIRLLIQ